MKPLYQKQHVELVMVKGKYALDCILKWWMWCFGLKFAYSFSLFVFRSYSHLFLLLQHELGITCLNQNLAMVAFWSKLWNCLALRCAHCDEGIILLLTWSCNSMLDHSSSSAYGRLLGFGLWFALQTHTCLFFHCLYPYLASFFTSLDWCFDVGLEQGHELR